MDLREFGRIVGAFLFAGVFAWVVGFVSDVIFAAEMPAKPGWAVPVAGAPAASPAPAAARVEPIAVRLKTADVERGRKVFAKCASCHTPEKGGGAKIGPNLWGVVGGPKAHVDGLKYSTGMLDRAKAGETWSFADLDAFLADPKAVVTGTAMGFAGLKDAGDRADAILYLRSLADAPLALP